MAETVNVRKTLQIGTDRKHAAFRSVVQFADPKASLLPEGASETWAQLAMQDEFFYFGELVELTDEVFDTFIANFAAQQNPVPIFTDHEIGAAAGWVRQLERRDDGLWGLLEFVAETADEVRAGKWAFTSMGFKLQGVSRNTGKGIGPELFEVSLTNVPFIDGQQPLQMNRGDVRRMEDKASQLKLSEAGAAAAVPNENAEGAPATEPDDAPAEVTPMDELLSSLAEQTGLDPEALEQALRDNMDAIVAAIKGDGGGEGETAEFNRALEIKLSAVEKKNAELQSRLDERDSKDLEAEVDGFVESGNVLPGDREDALAFMRKDPATARKLFSSRKVVPVDTLPPEKGAEAGSARATYNAMSEGDRNVVNFHAQRVGFDRAVAKVQKVLARRAAAN